MFEVPHTHGIIKKVVIGFGTLFSNVQVERLSSAGVVAQIIDVPIAYAPKEKINVRVDQDSELANNVFTTLPRMSFEITGYSYDGTRMTNRNNTIKRYHNATVDVLATPVPYNLEISLYLLTKGTEDALAIIEQILPLFAPEYNLNMTSLPSMELIQDVPIVLNGVSVQDDFEGDFNTRRLVTHTFSFTAKCNLYGPIRTKGVITDVTSNVSTNTTAPVEAIFNATGNPTTGIKSPGTWTP